NNEFGPGLYCTPNFNLAVEYAGKNGAIFVYDWSNLDSDFTIKTLIDREWEDTVKGWICIIDDDSKPGPPQFDEDIIQGPVSKNHGSIYNCSKPIQSQDLQVVVTTTNENPEGIEYGENHLIIINDKLEKCLGESIRDAIDDVCEIIERWQKRVAKRYNQNFN
ncbi:2823_t:CDS:2, partial [Rhizophagus irregularis]